jgi:L-fucose isomerase-like protein
VRRRLAAKLAGLDDVEQEPLEKSLRLHLGLKQLVSDRAWRGVAVRCWPECFTEYGGAACTPMGMLASESVPACCEADVYGTVTSVILQSLTGGPTFVADLVDIDRRANTGVMWHCGLAPLDMADRAARPRATVHPNRGKPLLSEFPLMPGRVTIARLSQARDTPKIVVGSGQMMRSRLSFSGTSGVLRLDRPVADVLDTIMAEGLEHHYGLAYGDVREELRAIAALLKLPIVELG